MSCGAKLRSRGCRPWMASAPVAQWIERSPPEREVASSNLAGRVVEVPATGLVCLADSLAGSGVLIQKEPSSASHRVRGGARQTTAQPRKPPAATGVPSSWDRAPAKRATTNVRGTLITLSLTAKPPDGRDLALLPVDELALWVLQQMTSSTQATFHRSNLLDRLLKKVGKRMPGDSAYGRLQSAKDDSTHVGRAWPKPGAGLCPRA
jgi:hypothetical protein